jgi:hypothetical protein
MEKTYTIEDVDVIIAQDMKEVLVIDDLLKEIGLKIFESNSDKVFYIRNTSDRFGFKLVKDEDNSNKWHILNGDTAISGNHITINGLKNIVNNTNKDKCNCNIHSKFTDEMINKVAKQMDENIQFKTSEEIKNENKKIPDSITVPCRIFRRTDDNFLFVTTNLEYADDVYDSDDYIMIKAYLINP